MSFTIFIQSIFSVKLQEPAFLCSAFFTAFATAAFSTVSSKLPFPLYFKWAVYTYISAVSQFPGSTFDTSTIHSVIFPDLSHILTLYAGFAASKSRVLQTEMDERLLPAAFSFSVFVLFTDNFYQIQRFCKIVVCPYRLRMASPNCQCKINLCFSGTHSIIFTVTNIKRFIMTCSR